MSETPLATMSQDDEGSPSAASSDGTPKPSSTTTPTVPSSTPISEADYEAIADAVMETERGRWFLKEYARRNRNADTQTVLDALERLEDRISTAEPGGDTSVALISHNVIDLAEAITQVKREVQDLGGQGDDKDHFDSATEELEAIVSQTETATGEILEAAEKIQEVLWTLREEGASETQCDIIESKVIDVYTACSFQDLTGQRSSKVVRLVSYVEKRVSAMMDILGLSAKDTKAENASSPEAQSEDGTSNAGEAYQEGDERTDAHLLHGPALEGDGIEQDDVDALFDTAQATEPDEALVDDDPDSTASAEGVPVESAHDDDLVSDDEVDEIEHVEPETLKSDAVEPEALEGDLQTSTADNDSETKQDASEPSATEKDLARLDAAIKEARDTGESDNSDDLDADDSDNVDIITDEIVVELHDAEILRQPAEEALINNALSKKASAPDIFEVEALDFDGPDMGQGSRSDANLEIQSPRDDRKVLVDMQDDFVVDEGAADMFVDTGPNAADKMIEAASQTDATVAAQDIFDVDEFGFDEPDVTSGVETVADPETIDDAYASSGVQMVESEPEEALLDEALSELETAVSEKEPASDEPATGDQTDIGEEDTEPAPYTDEERIALFS